MYRCYICGEKTRENAFKEVYIDLFDRVVDHYSLIHCEGADDQFDEDEAVVLCQACIDAVPRPVNAKKLADLKADYERYGQLKDPEWRRSMQDAVRVEMEIEYGFTPVLEYTPRRKKRPWWTRFFQSGWRV